MTSDALPAGAPTPTPHPADRCPCCGSSNIETVRERRRVNWAGIIEPPGIDVEFDDERLRCLSCGEQWYTATLAILNDERVARAVGAVWKARALAAETELAGLRSRQTVSEPGDDSTPSAEYIVGLVRDAARDNESVAERYADELDVTAQLNAAAALHWLAKDLPELLRSRQTRDEDGQRASAEALARRFHETYERLAPSFGYATRPESAKPWSDVPDQNRHLMIAVCAELLAPSTPQNEGSSQ